MKSSIEVTNNDTPRAQGRQAFDANELKDSALLIHLGEIGSKEPEVAEVTSQQPLFMAVQYIAPESFTFYLSAAILVGLVVGGVGWLPGAFLGAIFVLIVPNVAETVSKGLSGAIYGVFLIVLIFFLPAGASTFRDFIFHRFQRKSGTSN